MNSENTIRGNQVPPTNSFIEVKKEEMEQSVPARFERMVRLYPDRTAVKTRTHEITYEALNRSANSVAHALIAQHEKREQPIALLLDDDVAIAIATIGLLKAGKICVHLEPSLPNSRMNYIIDETQVPLIITDNENYSSAAKLSGKRYPVFRMDDPGVHFSSDNLGLTIDPDSSAAIVYTSGSTGQPKGVVHSHRFLLHRPRRLYSGPMEEARVTAVGSARRYKFYATLVEGIGCFPWRIEKDSMAGLVNWLKDENITHYESVPSVFRLLCKTLTPQDSFPQLRVIRLTGELVTQNDIDLWRKHFSPDSVLTCALGASETGIIREYVINKDTVITNRIVPVGYEVPDMQVLLFDQDGKEVGFDCVGEIAVKSRYLASGYWRRPDLTKAVFRADPKGGKERIYLSGDLGRITPDGCLQYLGRKDDQVKIRGFKVEPGEIEVALLEHRAVKEAVILSWEHSSGEQRLAAYVVATKNPGLLEAELRSFLRQSLPEYMIPSVFVLLDTLPLTPNGKADRKALTALIPDQSRLELETPFVAPRDLVERQLAEIWEKVLGIHPIGVKHDFFELGGHSLLAMDVLVEMKKAFGKNLSLAALFQAPTVEQLAMMLRGERQSPLPSLLIPLQLKGSKPPFFCHGASLEMAVGAGQDQPFYGLEPHGQDGRRAPSTVEEMAADYIKEIRAIQPEGPYFLGGYSFGGIVAFEIAQQLQREGQKIALLVLIDPANLRSDLSLQSASSSVPTTPFGYEIYQHLVNLVRLGTREKLAYVLERIRWRLDGIKKKIKVMVCELYLSTGRRVPASLRKFYFFDVCHHVNLKYLPQIYPGRIIFLKAEKSSLGWNGLATGGLEIHELLGRHADLVSNPHAQLLGEKLRSCFERAHATLSERIVSTCA
ncbi:MAG: acyl-CoA synthetase [Deltaproteobacteria bacterium]|nr:MAG: acyl-CoA synthetase [Deltaproteobacteria bacterium]